MRMAIIDMGTNTFNLLIVETSEDKKYKILFKGKEGVKLGKGGINNNIITPEAFNRGVNAIEKHIINIKKFNTDRIIATATSGIRSTTNGKEFVNTIENKFGLKIKIVSGDEEADLIYRGVKQAIKFNSENTLILDIGGGSNEFIIANDKGLLWKHSFNLGIARLLDMFMPSNPITPKEIEKVEEYIDSELSVLYDAVKIYHPKSLIGCSGTFNTFRSIIMAKNGSIPKEIKNKASYPISMEEYSILHEELLNSTLEERNNMKGLEPVRVEMIVLASIFVNFIINKLEINSLTQSAFAIKEGLVNKILNS